MGRISMGWYHRMLVRKLNIWVNNPVMMGKCAYNPLRSNDGKVSWDSIKKVRCVDD